MGLTRNVLFFGIPLFRHRYPTNRGDLYGGGHYLISSAATMTKQGKAIFETARRFAAKPGDNTLPFTPCKRGYIPILTTDKSVDELDGEKSKSKGCRRQRMVACSLHNELRLERLKKEGGKFRVGEVDLDKTFWSKLEAKIDSETTDQSQGNTWCT